MLYPIDTGLRSTQLEKFLVLRSAMVGNGPDKVKTGHIARGQPDEVAVNRAAC
jgi:hypothetical protein